MCKPSSLETRAKVASCLRLTLQRLNPEVPPETITNAVMHRDWFIHRANVFVEIYEDRIEVSSPGGLPKGMLPEDLGTKSVRRNPLIADLLHRIAFIEKAGTGIRWMRQGARSQGYPEPEFSADSFFTAVFQPLPAVVEQDTLQVTRQVGTKQGSSRAHDQAHDTVESTAHGPRK